MHRSHRLELDPDLERQIEELAKASGVSAVDLVRDAIAAYAARDNGRSEQAEAGTLLDAFEEAGLVGCLPDAPADLSTNPAYFEGFGRD